jgi:hypothetical protein
MKSEKFVFRTCNCCFCTGKEEDRDCARVVDLYVTVKIEPYRRLDRERLSAERTHKSLDAFFAYVRRQVGAPVAYVVESPFSCSMGHFRRRRPSLSAPGLVARYKLMTWELHIYVGENRDLPYFSRLVETEKATVKWNNMVATYLRNLAAQPAPNWATGSGSDEHV